MVDFLMHSSAFTANLHFRTSGPLALKHSKCKIGLSDDTEMANFL